MHFVERTCKESRDMNESFVKTIYVTVYKSDHVKKKKSLNMSVSHLIKFV